MRNILHRSHLVVAPVACAGLAVLFGAAPARAQALVSAAAWSVAGSTGVVDESSTSLVAFDNTGGVSIKLTAPAGSVAVVRYPVSFLPTHTYGIHTGFYDTLDTVSLVMTFRKPDDNSYASATLKRVRVSDGVVSSVASVNTFASVPAAAAQQVEKTTSCGENEPCINTYTYAYYIELVLWKPDATNDPKAIALRVYTSKF
jgi:hypothetical protein